MIGAVIIVICLLVNALLAGAEMAFVAVSKPTLPELVRQGHKKAELLLHLREHPERTLSVIQIGITMVAALAGAVGGPVAEEILSPSIEAWLGIEHGTERNLNPESTKSVEPSRGELTAAEIYQ
jgi:putative hemolysin